MTGGASRMDFLKPLICDCWGVTEDKIYRDPDPSLTISQGVAELARADLRSSGKDKEIGKDIEHLKQSNVIYEDFIKGFGSELNKSVVSRVANAVKEFSTSSSDKSLDQLQSDSRHRQEKSIFDLFDAWCPVKACSFALCCTQRGR